MGDLDPKEREVCRERRGAMAHLVPLDSLENMDHQVCLALLGTWEYKGSREPRVTTVPLEASDPRGRRERGRRERRERREREAVYKWENTQLQKECRYNASEAAQDVLQIRHFPSLSQSCTPLVSSAHPPGATLSLSLQHCSLAGGLTHMHNTRTTTYTAARPQRHPAKMLIKRQVQLQKHQEQKRLAAWL